MKDNECFEGDIKGSLYIDGSWVRGSGDIFSSYEPFMGKEIWSGRSANREDIDSSVHSASQAFSTWSELSIDERYSYLNRFVQIVKLRRRELEESISVETGKPTWEAASEIDAVIGKLEPTLSSHSIRASSIINNSLEDIQIQTKFVPHGVIAVIGPYNLPAHIPNGQILPALLAGNCIVFKPSEMAPLVSEKMIECWHESGLPRGVINLVQGCGATGKLLCSHKDIKGVFFTGSEKTGNEIASICSDSNKMVVLELGGNNPLIIWDSSNLDATVLSVIQSAYLTTGQRCSSCKRIIVQNNEFGRKFIDELVIATKKLRFGSFLDKPEPFAGPLRSSKLSNHFLVMQEEFLSMNEKSLLMAKRSDISNNLISPAIIDATKSTSTFDEELLGPLIRIYFQESFDDALKIAETTRFGLAAGVFTENRKLFERAQKKLSFGIVNWNRPITSNSSLASFGGIKCSGNYRPSGYLTSDYCVYAKASVEQKTCKLPVKLPPGVDLTITKNQ